MAEGQAAVGRSRLARLEDLALVVTLAAMVALPVLEIAGRRMRVPTTILLVQQLTLWLGLLGAAAASRERRHIALAHLAERLPGRLGSAARLLASGAAAAVATLLVRASVDFVLSLRASPTVVYGVPEWLWAVALPLGFALVALREIHAAPHGWKGRLAVLALVAGVCGLGLLGEASRAALVLPGILALGVATFFGAPLFALLGGAALLLFAGEGVPLAAIPAEAYRLVVSPTLPTIPLFTLAGYVLAEGGASHRLVKVFRAAFGWLPGGPAVAAACACAFFTSFTGGSGVTILALGGLLLPALIEAGYSRRYSVGLLTAAGSLGLLFPPSLPVILYGVVSETPIDRLFAGALLPGFVLLGAVAVTGFRESRRTGAGRAPFVPREALRAAWEAKWELLLPLVVLFGMFGGFGTFVEAAAATALYAIVVETLVYRDLAGGAGLRRAFVSTATVVGGVLVILCVALGLTSYLVDAEVPARAVEWVRGNIETRAGFLIALNLFLLAVGCLMDIFSAIVVVIPIIRPIAAAYGVDPIHLGVIFLANLELGFLTPPVGLNLFLASLRFERPVLAVIRDTLPFLLILVGAVLLITYVPAITSVGVELFERAR